MTALPSLPPYTPKEAAARLGCSHDLLERRYADLGGIKVGVKVFIPRHAVDALVDGPDAGKAPLERVLALVAALSEAERVEVARACLVPAGSSGGGAGGGGVAPGSALRAPRVSTRAD